MPTAAGPQVYVVVHGHFYQPPRENPWIEEIELEESAYPFPNWNARITRECYLPNTCARIRDEKLRVLDIINNFEYINFNIGPTLISWLAAQAPVTYERILAADAASVARLGFGNAIAQAYNHAILPLANSRDRRTQIIWGLRDFSRRFGRPAEAMWLPETAVNLEVLRDLAAQGMKYIILSPWQARRVRPLTGGPWQDVSNGSIDTTQPYRCFLGPAAAAGPRPAIDIFFYDGQTAAALSFGDLLSDSGRFLDNLGAKLRPGASGPQLLSVATDGETFGHHKHFGEMGLAYALSTLCPQRGWQVTNYRAFLELSPPRLEVEISLGPDGKGSAWSCAHGVGRWERDCGCHTGGGPGWNQKWRQPLRQAFDFLNDRLAAIFTRLGSRYFQDPWAARDEYIDVILDRSPASQQAFFRRHGTRSLTAEKQVQAILLLEMQRHVLLMYTSCGWFFADLSGLETLQVLKYAARALQLGQRFTSDNLEEPFLAILAEAKSNLPEQGSGRDLYLHKVKPAVITYPKLVNHFSITLLNDPERRPAPAIFHYRPELLQYEEKSQGGLELACGRVRLTSGITQESQILGYATLFLGSYLYRTQVQADQSEADFNAMAAHLFQVLAETPENIATVMADFFQGPYYSVHDMFKLEKREILRRSLHKVQEEAELELVRGFGEVRPVLATMAREGFVIPRLFTLAAFTTLRRTAREIVAHWQAHDSEHQMKRELEDVQEIAQTLNVHLQDDPLGLTLAHLLERSLQTLHQDFSLAQAQTALATLTLCQQLPVAVDLMEAQNLFFYLMQEHRGRLALLHKQPPARRQEFARTLLELAAGLGFQTNRYEALLKGSKE
jgi:alpha-amylase/alpha-mannosidase (GH57 family)